MSAGSGSTAPGKPVSAKVPFYAFVTQEADVAAIKAFAEKKGLPAGGVLQGDASAAAEFLKSNPPSTVLMVEVPSAEAAPALLNGLADVCDPTTKVIVVGSINEYSFFCWLTEIGISSYLLKPLTGQMLDTAWAKAVEPPPSAAGQPAKAPARFIGFIGTRGGVGSTTLSILFSTMLAQQPADEEGKAKKVALVDLDPQDGSVALLLDIDPSRGLREALERPDRIDSLFLDRVMQKSALGFSVLSAEEGLHEQPHYHAQAPDILVAELQRQFDIVVLDVPRRITPFVRGFLAMCDPIFAVTDLSLLGLRDSLRLSDLFRDYLRIKLPVFIANRAGMAGKHELGKADFKKAVSADVAYQFPFAPEFFVPISADLKIKANKKAAAYKVLEQLVNDTLPPPAKEGEAKKGGLLKRGK